VLTDRGQERRYIKTVHGRGYRFVAPVHVQGDNVRAASFPVRSTATAPAASGATHPPVIFGREQELAHLRACYEQAAAGQRNVLFVTGEAGRGKSTLIDAFVAGLAGGDGVRIAIGHCAQQRGVGEPFMPAIEAVSSLCESYGQDVTSVVARRAPAWLLQAPWLLGDEDLLRPRARP
jgi:hypothetical protein